MLKNIKITGILFILLGLLAFAGCGDSYNAPAAIIGEWTCHETATDQTTDTSFYALSVQEDGTFSLYDQASGNPGIAGKMSCDDTGNLGIINIECNSDDFDPPICWNISENARLRYKVVDDNTIKLGYSGIWLVFDRAK